MAIGYLLVQARTAHGAVPISGVQVRIQDSAGRPVYELTTDENGETPMVSLETVDKSLSLDSGYSGEPYKSYEVFAGVRGFLPVHVSGVAVFEGERAVLTLALVPEGKEDGQVGGGGRQSMMEITIGKPAVAMEGERHQEGPLSSAYVLRYVVIPNPITVHLGSPASQAANFLPRLCKKCGEQRNLSHLAAGGSAGQYLCDYHFCAEPGFYRMVQKPGLRL